MRRIQRFALLCPILGISGLTGCTAIDTGLEGTESEVDSGAAASGDSDTESSTPTPSSSSKVSPDGSSMDESEGEGDSSTPSEQDSEESSTAESDATDTGSSSESDSDSNTSTSTGDSDDDNGDESSDQSSDDGGDDCPRRIVLLGYWPPTNEMLRDWSQNPDQNPSGWIGEDWQGSGYDVYSFFPEFPPDGDPTNDPIGGIGAVGSEASDMRVDYQDSSADFWRLMDEYQPQLLITTSRGGSIGWELEAIEGGHSGGTADDPSGDWISDGYGSVTLPTRATVPDRSWQTISEFRNGQTLHTALPIDDIADATRVLGLASVEVDETGTSGNFLSGYAALHGLAYHELAAHNASAGHIHVGINVAVGDARVLIEATLDAVIANYPAETTPCPQ